MTARSTTMFVLLGEVRHSPFRYAALRLSSLRSRSSGRAVLAVALAVLHAPSASAAPVLDQSNIIVNSNVSGIFTSPDESFRRAQVVTAGVTGLMTEINIQTSQTSGITNFNILQVANGLPTGTVLGTASFASAANGLATFNSALSVSQGEQFAIEPVGGSHTWTGANGSYAGGNAAYLNTAYGINNFTSDPTDYGFQTYVMPGTLTLDQSNIFASPKVFGSFSSGDDSSRRAQVITAGQTGTLAEIQIQTTNSSFSNFNILQVVNGLPTDVVLGTAVFASQANDLATFTSSLFVNQGDQFALEPVGGPLGWAGGSNASYSGGDGAYLNQLYGPDSFTSGPNDFGFNTYVLSAVPEAPTWTIMIAGFGAVGMALRRRRREPYCAA